jgi:hypothetical protein
MPAMLSERSESTGPAFVFPISTQARPSMTHLRRSLIAVKVGKHKPDLSFSSPGLYCPRHFSASFLSESTLM